MLCCAVPVPVSSTQKSTKMLGQNHFVEPNWHVLTFLLCIFPFARSHAEHQHPSNVAPNFCLKSEFCLFAFLKHFRAVAPTGAHYGTRQKFFSHPSLILYFFPTPPIKLKLRFRIGERLLIANHLDQTRTACTIPLFQPHPSNSNSVSE